MARQILSFLGIVLAVTLLPVQAQADSPVITPNAQKASDSIVLVPTAKKVMVQTARFNGEASRVVYDSEKGRVELHGNVHVQGWEFTAQCDHMTFNEKKDQMILLGENDNLAVLSKSVIKGQRPQTFRAKKIIYYRTTGMIEVPVLGSFGG